MFAIRINPEFGPGWEVLKDGEPIAAAHEEPDAKDFIAGRITIEELRQRNEAIERGWREQ